MIISTTSKPRFILHVGLPKCTSTALQYHFWKYRTWLKSQGFEYPETNNTPVPKQQFMVSQLLGKGLDFDWLEQLSRSSPCTILSTEGLTNHLYDFPQCNLKTAAAYFSRHHTIGLLIHRPRKSWIRSYYIQCTLNPPTSLSAHYATALTLEAFSHLKRVNLLARHQQVARDVRDGFGLSACYTIEQSDHLLDELAARFDIPVPEHATLERVNVSPPGYVIEIIRQLNAFDEVRCNRDAWLGAIQKWADTDSTIMKMYLSSTNSKTISQLNAAVFERLTPNTESEFRLCSDQISSLVEWFGNVTESSAS